MTTNARLWWTEQTHIKGKDPAATSILTLFNRISHSFNFAKRLFVQLLLVVGFPSLTCSVFQIVAEMADKIRGPRPRVYFDRL